MPIFCPRGYFLLLCLGSVFLSKNLLKVYPLATSGVFRVVVQKQHTRFESPCGGNRGKRQDRMVGRKSGSPSAERRSGRYSWSVSVRRRSLGSVQEADRPEERVEEDHERRDEQEPSGQTHRAPSVGMPYPTAPGSGNAYARSFLDSIFPLEPSIGDFADSVQGAGRQGGSRSGAAVSRVADCRSGASGH